MQQGFAREQTGGRLWDHRVSVLWTRAVAVGVMSLTRSLDINAHDAWR